MIPERFLTGGSVMVQGVEVYISPDAINQHFVTPEVLVNNNIGIDTIADLDQLLERAIYNSGCEDGWSFMVFSCLITAFCIAVGIEVDAGVEEQTPSMLVLIVWYKLSHDWGLPTIGQYGERRHHREAREAQEAQVREVQLQMGVANPMHDAHTNVSQVAQPEADQPRGTYFDSMFQAMREHMDVQFRGLNEWMYTRFNTVEASIIKLRVMVSRFSLANDVEPHHRDPDSDQDTEILHISDKDGGL
ncbi:hypothetical protein Ddye_005848 [Dipteronia dyeriana]|uniref:Uncharacterized protein n=1 Tax=Dipteronia dyeriana TaxID=168575 RepID=A0AAD9XH82_9ROSI|nr:hypothetical protein Ddye_005848 [Dipteronia dyeriana]